MSDVALALQHGAARDHDVAARAVELEDREAPALADVAIEVARRADVGVRARQERGDADVDLEAALHLADDRALDRALRFERLLDVAPHLSCSAFWRDSTMLAVLGVGGLEVDVDRRRPSCTVELAVAGA